MSTSKKLCITLIFIQLFTLTRAQDYLNKIDSILFFPGITEPDTNWNKIDFDDSSWQLGGGIIGYGDVIDTEIDPVMSVYTRSYFNIESIDSYEEMALLMDFDDGFAAYINGVQIARVNLGKLDSNILHNQLADRSHEAELVKYINEEILYPVLCYYIDKAFIDSVLIEGTNVLSIEVHNDSIDGSDLSVFGLLADITNLTYDIFNPFDRHKRCMELDSTKLPIIIIESDEYGIPFKRVEVPATIGIIDNGDGNYNQPTDAINGHSGPIKIEVRGESSAIFPKRSYDFELQDEQENDTSVSLLGMPKESDWILQGPFADKSQIRNAIIYNLGLRTGHWTPRVKFCEVIINGEYVGLYNLIEEIKRDSNRVNIGKLTETEISGTDLTGGYILKYDKPDSDTITIAYPNSSDIQPEQKNYILNFINEYESNLYSNDGLNEEIGYKKYIDENSLIDYAIIAEFAKNCDAYLYSSYLHKDKDDRDGRLIFGPLWDFDLCFGNSIWQEGYQTYNWQWDFPSNNEFNITRLFEDPMLVDQFEDRWFELRDGMLHLDSLFNSIESLTSELAEPINRNYEVWPVVDKGIFFPAYIAPDYNSEIDSVKSWIFERVAWMDDNIGNIYYPITDFPTTVNSPLANKNSFKAEVYPNPFANEFLISLNIPESGNILIELIDIQGRTVNIIENTYMEQGALKIYWNKRSQKIESGLYLLSIKLNGKLYQQIKMLCTE